VSVPVRLGLVMLAALLVQLTVFVDVRFFGVAPELLSLVAVIGAFLIGSERGPVLAFIAGLIWDVYLPTPLGVMAITLAIVAYAVATLNEGLFQDSPSQLMMVVFLASGGAVLGYALLGGIMGSPELLRIDMFRIALIVGITNAVVTPLAVPAMTWALGGEGAMR
jgi:rod shape-determining protein MreD